MQTSEYIPTSFSQRSFSYSVPAPTLKQFHGIKNWINFHRAVISKVVNAEYLALNFESNGNDIKEYFESVLKSAEKHVQSSENNLTIKCLNPLITFTNCVIEDTSNKISDYSKLDESTGNGYSTDVNASSFRTFQYIRGETSGEKSDRTDIVVRDVEDEDMAITGNKPYAVLPYPANSSNSNDKQKLEKKLPPGRMLPLRIRSIIELKKILRELLSSDNLHQLVHYLESVLRISPLRKVAFGILTNLMSFVFVAVISTTHGYDAWRSDEVQSDQLPTEFSSFLSTSPSSLGVVNHAIYMKRELIPIVAHGRGSTGMVFSAHWTNNSGEITEVAVKLSRNRHALLVERRVVCYLLESDPTLGTDITTIHNQAQASMEQYFEGHVNCFEHILKRAKHSDLNEHRFMKIWDTLQRIHTKGIVHCDVRPPNMMSKWRSTDEMVLVDFCSARVWDATLSGALNIAEIEPNYQEGAYSTAADPVLLGHPTLPADEGASLVLAALQVAYNSHMLHGPFQTKEQALEDRRGFFDQFEFMPSESQTSIQLKRVKEALNTLSEIRTAFDSKRITHFVREGVNAAFCLARIENQHKKAV